MIIFRQHHTAAVEYFFLCKPWYIVFSPDIHYTIGHPGKSAYDYVVSGAQEPWLKKNGLMLPIWAYKDIAGVVYKRHSWLR